MAARTALRLLGRRRTALPVKITIHHTIRIAAVDGNLDTAKRPHQITHHTIIQVNRILHINTKYITNKSSGCRLTLFLGAVARPIIVDAVKICVNLARITRLAALAIFDV